MRALTALLLASALACGVPPARAPATAPPAASFAAASAAWSLDGRGGVEPAAARLAERLRAERPELSRGKVAVAWPAGSDGALGRALVRGWGAGAVAAADLGLKGAGPADLLAQLDPATFSGLLWVVLRVEAPVLEAWSPQDLRRPTLSVPLRFEPPLFRSVVPAAGKNTARPWLQLSRPAAAVGWEPDGRTLWLRTPDRVVRLDAATRAELGSWPVPALEGGPSLLRWVPGRGVPGAMALFDLRLGEGRWFAPGPGGRFAPGERLASFPLEAHTSRFLAAPWNPTVSAFDLSTTPGEPLGPFTDLVRFQGPSFSVFAALAPDGRLWAVRGDLLALLPGPGPEPCSALASGGGTLYAARAGAPFVVLGFRLNADLSWEEVWRSESLAAPPVSLAAGERDGRTVLFALIPEQDGGGALYLLEPPIR